MTQPPSPAPTASLAGTTFFARTYEEALALAEEARDYLAHPAHGGEGSGSGPERLAYAGESLRLTPRLSQTMAWLLVHRAVHAGELTLQEALDRGDLGDGHPLCLESGDLVELPRGLASLMERSEALYWRVRRLNELMARA